MQGIQDRLEDVGSRLGPFADAFEAVQREIREKFKQSSQQHGVWEGLQEFAHAVKWTEPWILALVSLQIVFFTSALILRNNTTAASILFGFGALIVFNAERINALAAQHHKYFTDQPYFDKHGIFFSAVVSAPLLLSMFILLVNYLVTVSNLLIKMKQKELRYKARQRSKADKQESDKKPHAS